MTSREHARRLMLILLSSEGAPGAETPDALEVPRTERDEDSTRRESRDECSEGDRPRALAGVLVRT